MHTVHHGFTFSVRQLIATFLCVCSCSTVSVCTCRTDKEVLYLLDAVAHLGRWQCCCRGASPLAARCTVCHMERTHRSEYAPANPARTSANTHSTETTPRLLDHLRQRVKERKKTLRAFAVKNKLSGVNPLNHVGFNCNSLNEKYNLFPEINEHIWMAIFCGHTDIPLL